jgi:hypothetical protein
MCQNIDQYYVGAKKKRKNTKIKDCFRFYCGKLNRLHTIHKWKKEAKENITKQNKLRFFLLCLQRLIKTNTTTQFSAIFIPTI